VVLVLAVVLAVLAVLALLPRPQPMLGGGMRGSKPCSGGVQRRWSQRWKR
jgi:hypothetical protein